MWWLVTWTTYASWLPGDPRGFRTWRGREYIPPPKRFAKPGEESYRPADHRNRLKSARAMANDSPVTLNATDQRLLLDAIVDEIDAIPLLATALSINAHHVHLLAKFDPRPIRQVAGRLKAAATRTWHERGGESPRLWSRNCNMKSKPDRTAFDDAYGYVVGHASKGALIHTWTDITF